MLDRSTAKQKTENKHRLGTIIRLLQLVGRQNLAIRGTYTPDGEVDSNLSQLLLLVKDANPQVQALFDECKTKKYSYTSPEIQNELLGLMSASITREIAAKIRSSGAYTIMVDEASSYNKEYLIFCLRWVRLIYIGKYFEIVAIKCLPQVKPIVFRIFFPSRWVDDSCIPHEEFLGVYHLDSANAETLVTVIKDILLRLNLPLAMCRGQCYDGASVMSGAKSGVSTRIQQVSFMKFVDVQCSCILLL